MESSITKIVIKKVLEKMGDCPLEKLPVRYGPSHLVLTFTDDPPPPPLRPQPSPPQEKMYLPLAEFNFIADSSSLLFPLCKQCGILCPFLQL